MLKETEMTEFGKISLVMVMKFFVGQNLSTNKVF